MAEGFVFSVDPSELDRFAAPEPEEGETEDEEKEDTRRRIADTLSEEFLARIPPREADLLTMYFFDGKKQQELATVFGVTQAAISYRMQRALKRLKFLHSVPILTEEGIRRDLAGVCVAGSPRRQGIDVEILVGMWKTACQSLVARQLHLSQGRVRHRFWRVTTLLEKLAAKDPERYGPYAEYFRAIISAKAFNITRQIDLPQWATSGRNRVG